MKKDTPFGYLIVAFVFTINNLWVSGLVSFGIFYPVFLDYFKTTKASTALIGALHSGSSAFSALFIGGLVKKFGCRMMAIAGCIVTSGGFLSASFCSSIYCLIPTYGMLSGVGEMMVYISAMTQVQGLFDKKRGRALAICMLGTSSAMVVWPIITQYLIDTYAWRGALMIISGAILNILPLSLMFVSLDRIKGKYKTINQVEEDTAINQSNDIKPTSCYEMFGLDLRKNSTYLVFTASLFFLSFGYSLLLLFTPVRALSIGMNKYEAVSLATAYGIANVIARFTVAVAADHPKMNRYILYTTSLSLLGATIISIPFLTTYPFLIAGLVIAGFTLGCCISLHPSLLGDMVGTKLFAPAMSYSLFVIGIAATISSPVTGFIADIMGEYHSDHRRQYEVQYYAYGACSLMAAIMMICNALFTLRHNGSKACSQNSAKT